MKKMTLFYEPGVDNNMILHSFKDEDLQIETITNAEAIYPEDEEGLYGIFDSTLHDRNYTALAEHYDIHEASNKDLHLMWMEIMSQRWSLNSKHSLEGLITIGRHAPDPLWDSLSLNL